jgi:hypothetical protein
MGIAIGMEVDRELVTFALMQKESENTEGRTQK